MSIAKVTLRFDVLPEEKEQLEAICNTLHITKIEFLRRAISCDYDNWKQFQINCGQSVMDQIQEDGIQKPKYCHHCKYNDDCPLEDADDCPLEIQKEGEK